MEKKKQQRWAKVKHTSFEWTLVIHVVQEMGVGVAQQWRSNEELYNRQASHDFLLLLLPLHWHLAGWTASHSMLQQQRRTFLKQHNKTTRHLPAKEHT